MSEHHSDPGLLKAFRKFNKLYFDSSLPEDNVVLCWEPQDDNASGECARIHEAGVEGRETDDFIIRIDPLYRTSHWAWKVILLHECIHVKLWPYVAHGEKFDREIARLGTFRSYRRLL
jgi:hypothetical protein